MAATGPTRHPGAGASGLCAGQWSARCMPPSLNTTSTAALIAVKFDCRRGQKRKPWLLHSSTTQGPRARNSAGVIPWGIRKNTRAVHLRQMFQQGEQLRDIGGRSITNLSWYSL